MRWLIPQPCIGSRESVRRTRRSRVPRRTSDEGGGSGMRGLGGESECFLLDSDRSVGRLLSEVNRSVTGGDRASASPSLPPPKKERRSSDGGAAGSAVRERAVRGGDRR